MKINRDKYLTVGNFCNERICRICLKCLFMLETTVLLHTKQHVNIEKHDYTVVIW